MLRADEQMTYTLCEVPAAPRHVSESTSELLCDVLACLCIDFLCPGQQPSRISRVVVRRYAFVRMRLHVVLSIVLLVIAYVFRAFKFERIPTICLLLTCPGVYQLEGLGLGSVTLYSHWRRNVEPRLVVLGNRMNTRNDVKRN